VKAVDTNILVYARIAASPHHARARLLLGELAEGSVAWAIAWPCIYEFLRIVTHTRVYHPPLTTAAALESVRNLLDSPSLMLLSETSMHFAILEQVVQQSGVTGNLMHDAHIVALCLEHGATELLTGDRDFARFSGLRITNPLIA
jgi:toxin-antitoxin system PIN domain toxin